MAVEKKLKKSADLEGNGFTKPLRCGADQKKLQRKQELSKLKLTETAIAVANQAENPLERFSASLKFQKNGVCAELEHLSGRSLSAPVCSVILRILNENMAPHHPDDWPRVEQRKKRETVDPDARFIFVRGFLAPRTGGSARGREVLEAELSQRGPQSDACMGKQAEACEGLAAAPDTCRSFQQKTDVEEPVERGNSEHNARSGGSDAGEKRVADFGEGTDKSTRNGGHPILGFVHYRFVVEEGVPVLYVYELQLRSAARGRGLGKFLMQLLMLVAREHEMKGVMLTVQRRNVKALHFYLSKLGFKVSPISPSQCNPLEPCDYEILSKMFEQIPQTVL